MIKQARRLAISIALLCLIFTVYSSFSSHFLCSPCRQKLLSVMKNQTFHPHMSLALYCPNCHIESMVTNMIKGVHDASLQANRNKRKCILFNRGDGLVMNTVSFSAPIKQRIFIIKEKDDSCPTDVPTIIVSQASIFSTLSPDKQDLSYDF